MTVLSQQTLIDKLKSGEVGIYRKEDGRDIQTDPSEVNSNSINIMQGTKVGAIDHFRVATQILHERDVSPIEAAEFLTSSGINAIRDRKAIEAGLRILDLGRKQDYDFHPMGGSVYRAYTKDGGFSFPTHVVEENGQMGIVLHPESYSYNQRISWLSAMLRSQSRIQDMYSHLLRKMMEKPKEKDLHKEILNKIDRENYYVRKTYENVPIPSTSFTLMWTHEYIRMPNYITADIEGKSKWARIGLSPHPSSGKVDSGFDNQLVLEIKNVSDMPHRIFPMDSIAELKLEYLDKSTKIGYKERKDSLYKDGTTL